MCFDCLCSVHVSVCAYSKLSNTFNSYLARQFLRSYPRLQQYDDNTYMMKHSGTAEQSFTGQMIFKKQ